MSNKKCIPIIIFVLTGIICATLLFYPRAQAQHVKTEYLRIHIRANSNSTEDQNVKYIVKEEVVSYLTPFLTNCDSKEKAQNVIESHLAEIEKIADRTLTQNGFNYTSNASVLNEKFPTRSYADFTLDAGYYDALIINLGSGEGDNWWCVVYPPLCFVSGTGNYTYRSKLVEIINLFISRGN